MGQSSGCIFALGSRDKSFDSAEITQRSHSRKTGCKMNVVRIVTLTCCCIATFLAVSSPVHAIQCSTSISPAVRARLHNMTWPEVASSARDSKTGAFVVAPAIEWLLSATLFAGRAAIVIPNGVEHGNQEIPVTPPVDYLPALGYDDVAAAQSSIVDDVSGVARMLDADGVRVAIGLFLGPMTSMPAPARTILERKCIEVIRRPLTIENDWHIVAPRSANEWTSRHTGGLVTEAVREEEGIGGFDAGYAVGAATIQAVLEQPVADRQKVGALFVPAASGSQEERDERVYRYFADATAGLQGVAIGIRPRGTLYAITSTTRDGLQTFETSLTDATWQATKSRFRRAQGAVFLGSAFSMESYRSTNGVDAFGGSATAPSLKSTFIARDSLLEAGVTIDVVIKNPSCCSDAAPTPAGLPPLHFTMKTGGPVLYVLEDANGLVLFVAGD